MQKPLCSVAISVGYVYMIRKRGFNSQQWRMWNDRMNESTFDWTFWHLVHTKNTQNFSDQHSYYQLWAAINGSTIQWIELNWSPFSTLSLFFEISIRMLWFHSRILVESQDFIQFADITIGFEFQFLSRKNNY